MWRLRLKIEREPKMISTVCVTAGKKASLAGAAWVAFGGSHMLQLKFGFYSVTIIKILKVFSTSERYASNGHTGLFRFV